MFRFENAWLLYLLLLLPLLGWLFYFWRKKRNLALQKLGAATQVQKLIPLQSPLKLRIKLWLWLSVFAALIIAWANPQWGTVRERLEARPADIYVAFDVSESMWATDILPNRLERAQSIVVNLLTRIKKLDHGEQVSLISFAGAPNVETPLSFDFESVTQFIRALSPEQVSTPGTNIGKTLDLIRRLSNKDQYRQRIVLLVSDGEGHDDQAIKQARLLSKQGAIIVTLGVGTSAGGNIPIPFMQDGPVELKRNKEGEVVLTKLNEAALMEIAKESGGAYFNINQTDALQKYLKDQLTQMDSTSASKRRFKEFITYYQFSVFLALLLLVIEFVVSFKRSTWLESRDLFG